MKLTKLLMGGAAMAFAIGAGSSAFAANNVETFSVTGSVTATCLIYFSNTTGAIGNIPVNTVASSPSSTYFHMTDTNGDSVTLLGQGGCNDDNTVEIAKTNANGMTSSNTSSFDPTVFQNTLPYHVELGWTGTQGGNQHGPNTQQNEGLPVLPNQQTSGAPFANGAFASSMNITFLVEDQPLALLSGSYSDTVTVTLTAS